MLWTLIVILLILWLLGAFVRPVGSFVHVLLVIVLTGYQGWITSYGRKLANGHREQDDKKLRMMNELPGILTAFIVVLVIVRPF